jgi:hypothetical protein
LIMKVTAFWVMMSCGFVGSNNVSEEHAASIFKVKM